MTAGAAVDKDTWLLCSPLRRTIPILFKKERDKNKKQESSVSIDISELILHLH